MTRWLFPKYDPDTKEALSEEMELNKIGDFHAVGSGGRPVPVPMFDESGLEWLVEYFRDTIREGLQCPFMVTGLPGRGKSTFALKVLTQLRPNLELHRIRYYLEDILENVTKDSISDPSRNDYRVNLYDEAITGLFNQDWQSAVTNIKVLNIVRIKLQTIGYVLPHKNDMNPKIHPMMQAWVYLYRKGIAEIHLPLVNKHDGSVFWKSIMAIQFGPFDGPLWDAYSTQKLDFVKNYSTAVNQGDIGSPRLITVQNQRDDLIEHVVDAKLMSVNEVAELLRVKQNTISTWRTRHAKRIAKATNV